jgi:ssDNA-binding Zn-finger/Zn-ribbon topoisomerase 1
MILYSQKNIRTTNHKRLVSKGLCPKCGKRKPQGFLVVRLGKFGAFEACTNFPDCKYRTRINK